MKKITALLLIVLTLNNAAYASSYFDFVVEIVPSELGTNIYNFYSMPKSYALSHEIYYLGDDISLLNSPQDLYIDDNDTIYVADTNNNRVLAMTTQGDVLNIMDNKAEKGFNKPQSVFADDTGAIFVADTDNQRVVHLSNDGGFVEEFVRPNSDLLESDFVFAPRKISVSPTGYLYVIRHQWLMGIDANNEFKGFVSATQVGFDPIYLITKMLANEKQRTMMSKKQPDSILSFDIMKNGLTYAVTVDGKVKKLNSVGKNIYPKDSTFGVGTYASDNKTYKDAKFIDISVTDDEIIYLLEEWSGMIYVYDAEGENLAVFGGIGEGKEYSKVPVAIDVDSQNNVYVLDAGQNCIKVYSPTYFMNTVISAVGFYNKGDYDSDIIYWREVASMSENYRLSNRGIAKSLLKKGDYKGSMDYYEIAGDRAGYSKAYAKYRYDYFKQNFAAVTVIALITVILLYYILKLLNQFIKRELAKYHHVI